MLNLPPAMPLFDAIDHLEDGNPTVNQYLARVTLNSVGDAALLYELAVEWLLEQRYSDNNFKTYRSELTTFLYWVFAVERRITSYNVCYTKLLRIQHAHDSPTGSGVVVNDQ